jgi:predicted RNase H-like HicB family nuclease
MTHKYEIIIWWSDEDNAFIAEVPELPFCSAHGATYEEALKEVQVVMDAWIEIAEERGQPIPKPKGRRLMFA